jgi:hypothetical protein
LRFLICVEKCFAENKINTLGKISNYGDIDFSALAVSWKKNIIALESETDFESEQANVYFEKKGVITDENFASSDKVFMTFCVPFLAFAFKQNLSLFFSSVYFLGVIICINKSSQDRE